MNPTSGWWMVGWMRWIRAYSSVTLGFTLENAESCLGRNHRFNPRRFLIVTLRNLWNSLGTYHPNESTNRCVQSLNLGNTQQSPRLPCGGSINKSIAQQSSKHNNDDSARCEMSLNRMLCSPGTASERRLSVTWGRFALQPRRTERRVWSWGKGLRGACAHELLASATFGCARDASKCCRRQFAWESFSDLGTVL